MSVKTHLNIHLKTGLPFEMLLKEPCCELLKKINQTSGACVFAVFKVLLEPKKDPSDEISVEVSATTDTELPTVASGIERGIRKFVNEYEEKGISIKGFDAKIENQKFHPVDSNPQGYEYALYDMLRMLAGTEVFKIKINAFSLSGSFFDLKKLDRANQPTSFHGPALKIYLPRTFERTLILKDPWFMVLKSPADNSTQFQIRVAPSYNQKGPNVITLAATSELSDQANSHTFMHQLQSIYEQLRRLKTIFYKKQVNLGGLEVSVIYKFDKNKNPAKKPVGDFFICPLLSLLENEENIYLVNE